MNLIWDGFRAILLKLMEIAQTYGDCSDVWRGQGFKNHGTTPTAALLELVVERNRILCSPLDCKAILYDAKPCEFQSPQVLENAQMSGIQAGVFGYRFDRLGSDSFAYLHRPYGTPGS